MGLFFIHINDLTLNLLALALTLNSDPGINELGVYLDLCFRLFKQEGNVAFPGDA